MKRFRRFPKLTLVCHHATYLIAAVQMRYGPCNDAPDFAPAVIQALRHLPIDRLLGDGAYDAEPHHRLCRVLGIRSSVIPINCRGQPASCVPRTPHRRRMHRQFPRRIYRRRWHVESTISQHKRRIGPAFQARTDASREQEALLRVLTHDLMILRRAA
jgi:hypothetical protein